MNTSNGADNPRTPSAQLTELHDWILRMGVLVEEALRKALFALETKDYSLAEEVIRDDRRIDAMEREIDDRCNRIVAELRPAGRELRDVLTTIKITSTLERIGDHTRHIANRARVITDRIFVSTLPLIREMTERDIAMLHDFLTSYVEQDAERAMAAAAQDDAIDELHHRLTQRIIAILEEHPQAIEKGMDLMLVGRFLERFGDQITNMCEWVVFSDRAAHVELNQ